MLSVQDHPAALPVAQQRNPKAQETLCSPSPAAALGVRTLDWSLRGASLACLCPKRWDGKASKVGGKLQLSRAGISSSKEKLDAV